jgi:hypothetical protein
MLGGFALSYAVVYGAKAMFEGVNEDRLMTLIMVEALALTYTVAQWWIIRREIEGSTIWFWASFAGWLVAIALTAFLGRQGLIASETLGGRILLGILVGLIVGIAQWLPLRKSFQWASLWILGSVVGWSILMLVLGRSITNIFEMVLVGAIPGISTGLVLVVLTSHPRMESKGLLA